MTVQEVEGAPWAWWMGRKPYSDLDRAYWPDSGDYWLPLNHERNRGPQALQPCGTHAGYTRHRKAGEPACDECLRGERLYQQHRRARLTRKASR